MEKILFLSHIDTDGALARSSLEALSGVIELSSSLSGGSFVVGLIGEDAAAAAERIGSCGAEQFIGVSGDQFTQPRYASDAAAAEAVCREAQATIVIAPHTSRWARVLPGVASRFGGCVDSHVCALTVPEGSLQAARWFYRQRMVAQLQRTERPWFLLVDPAGNAEWSGVAQKVDVRSLSVPLSDALERTTVSGVREPEADEQTIRPDAKLLFVAGAGWTKKQADGEVHTQRAAELIGGFLRSSSSSLGSSKSLVDLESEGQGVLPFLTHLNQIGQTGATPRHPKGLATCCHGEEPHVVGWRFIGERRAVNTNPNCGWAQGKADVLYVADAFEVMAKVNELLSKA